MERFFLSIRWQVAISISVILVIGFGLLTYLGQNNLEQTYQSQRTRVYHDRQQALSTSLNTLHRQLTNIANHMQGIATRVAREDYRLPEVLAYNWDDLNFEWGVDGIAVFSSQGLMNYALGTPILEQLVTAQWIRSITASERPLHQIRCLRSCWQLVAVPALRTDGQVEVLVLVQDLADVVLEFQSSTSADIAILVPESSAAEGNSRRKVEAWQREIIALTGAPTSFEVLAALAATSSLQQLDAERKLQTLNTYSYEVSTLRLSESQSAVDASLLVIENVTADIQRLNSTLSNLFVAALLIFFLAEAALLGMLSVPMARLQRISQLLPKLADQQRHEVERELRVADIQPLVSNEIHRLFQSAARLCSTLQSLDDEVFKRESTLKQKSRELLKERNLVTTLLNNVPAVILIQRPGGKITKLNTEGFRLFDMKAHQETVPRFSQFFAENERRAIEQGLDGLFAGSETLFCHESQTLVGGDMQYYIDWRHTRLPDSYHQDPLVLSVGLDLTARKHAETNLAWLADHDPLTELMNRRRFQAEFEKILKKSERSGQPGVLIFCDVDQFKIINDTSGHPTGDQLLREIAYKLQQCIREVDVFARIGGDEFAIIAADTNREGASALAAKICEMMKNLELNIKGVSYQITLSLGVVLFPEHGTSADDLLANADLAMYKAKAADNGRNNWVVFSKDAPEKQWLHEQIDWKARIQKALEEERLILHYQPILDIGGDRIGHYEALVRMVDTKGDIIPPFRFIPIAEKTGLIYDIDRYVIKRAIRDLTQFQQQGYDINMAINLSATAITKMDFLSHVESLVTQYGVSQSQLIFELTETSAVEDVNATANIIASCRNLGYRFSLDDFGVGYASWFYLQQLPVDFVKIDGSFVRNLANSHEDRLFVAAINNVAQGLGKKTIAEYVDSKESLGILKDMGVDYAQGYHIGRPQAELLKQDDGLQQSVINQVLE